MAVPCPICTEPNEVSAPGTDIVCSLCGTAYPSPAETTAPEPPHESAAVDPEPEVLEEISSYEPLSEDDEDDEDDGGEDALEVQRTLETSGLITAPELDDTDDTLLQAATTVAKPPSKEELAKIAEEIDAEERAETDAKAKDSDDEPAPSEASDAESDGDEEEEEQNAEQDGTAEAVEGDFASAHTAVAKLPSPEEIARLAAVSRGEEPSPFSEESSVTPVESDSAGLEDESFVSAATVVSKAPTQEEIAAAVAEERARQNEAQADGTPEALPAAETVDANPMNFESTPTVVGADPRDLTVVGKVEDGSNESKEPGALGKGMRRLSVNLGWTAEEEEIADDPHHFYRIPSAVAVDYSFYSHSDESMSDDTRTGITRDLNDTGLALRAGRIPDALRSHIEHDLADLGMSLDIDLGHRTIQAQGKPLWRKDLPRGRMLLAVEFVDLHPGDAEALRQFAKSASMKPKVVAGVLVGLAVLAVLLALSGWLGSSQLEGAVDRLGESLERTTEQLGTANAQLETTQKQYSEAAAELDAQTKALEALAAEASELAEQFRENAALAGLETDDPADGSAGVPAYQELTARIEELQMLSEALREQLEAMKPKRKKGKRRKRK